MTKTLLALSLLFIFGCSTSGRVVRSPDFLDIIEREETLCFENKGEWTEYGCYFKDECFLLDKTPVPCEDIGPYPVKHKVQCVDIGGKWVDGKGCNLDD